MDNSVNQSNFRKTQTATTPVLVPLVYENVSKEQLIKEHEKFLSLPNATKFKLSRVETSKKIQAIGQKYGFDLLRLVNITRLIREYYFGEARLENFPAEIERRMGVSTLTAQEIARYIKQEIIDWDPWGEYIAKLPKMTVREIVEKRPKLADAEITTGYIALKNNDELVDPTIKNWVRDYVMHLGYEQHSQMQRTQYLFHSENGRDLDSPDREKLGIILRSFDENVALPIDEENNEIVFEGISEKVGDAYTRPAPATNTKAAYMRPLQPASVKQESFIKPYPAATPSPRPAAPVLPKPAPAQFPPVRQPSRQAASPPTNQTIPGVKIHSIVEHNEPKTAPAPRQTSPQPSPRQTGEQAYKKEGAARPKHKIIDPFSMPEPRIEGNLVDLSNNNK